MVAIHEEVTKQIFNPGDGEADLIACLFPRVGRHP